jgi:alkylation response protein AidB-like acyl-CoA dehydrogenase
MSRPLLARRDVDFLLFEWLEVERLTARARFADHSAETFATALDSYAAVASKHFAPHNRKSDQEEPTFDGERVRLNPQIKPALETFCGAGLMAAAQDYGLDGMQLPHVIERAGMAYVLAANAGTAAYAFLTMANANLLLTYALPPQIERFVKPMLTGRFLGTMCLSEPQAGSSLAQITTRAEPQSDGNYRLSGNKMWISGGEHDLSDNIVHLVLAKVPDAEGRLPAGVRGNSLFIVPKYLVHADGTLGERNDIALAGLNHKMGYRGTTNCLLNFGEGRFPVGGRPGAIGELVGGVGEGLACMFHMMNEARIAVGLSAAALGYSGYLQSLDYARHRVQGSTKSNGGAHPAKIIEHPDVRRMLLAQKAYAEGGLALALYSARLLDERATGATAQARTDAQRLLDLLTPITKSWPSQWCLAANDLAIQVHGGYGYARDYDVEQLYRDNRLNAIHEGTHGIQALDLLGRKVGQHEGASLKLLERGVHQTIVRAATRPALALHARSLFTALKQLIGVSGSLLELSDTRVALANASPYLEAFGHVVVAWLWLDQAVSADLALTARPDGPDADFYRGKLHACRYFFHWELPRAQAWWRLLEPVDTTCLDMCSEWY